MRHIPIIATLLAVAANAQQFAPELQKGFAPLPDSLQDNDYQLPVFSDLDGDGRPDLFLLTASGTNDGNRIYFNRAAGPVMLERTFGALPDEAGLRVNNVAIGDSDGDGDNDIAIAGRYPQQSRLYRNDGTGTFTDVTPTQMPTDDGANRIVFADIDGDGDSDMVLATGLAESGINIPDRIYVNDGSGQFTDATATFLTGIPNVNTDVALADVDGDGDLDMFGASGSPGASFSQLYLNDGSGTFQDATAGRIPDIANVSSATFVDLDGDGDPDLVTKNGVSPFERVLINNGTGFFTDETATRLPIPSFLDQLVFATRPGRHQFGDFDADGDLDMIADRLRLNDGTGTFTEAPGSPKLITSSVVDLEGDDDLDVWSSHSMYANDGTGFLSDRTVQNRYPLSFVDANGDSVSDVAIADTGIELSDGIARGLGLRAADIDGDGDLDLLGKFEEWTQFNLTSRFILFENDGGQTLLGNLHGPVFPESFTDAEFGDVDGDGDPDLVFSFSYGLSPPIDPQDQQTRLLLNDGTGNFTDVTAAQMPVDGAPTFAVELADISGNGALDIFLGRGEQFGGTVNRLYLNDGTGHFTDASDTLPSNFDMSVDVASGDIDADGDIDIVVGNSAALFGNGDAVRVLRNDGTGQLTNAGVLPFFANAVRLADFDEDGDADLVASEFGVGMHLARADGSGNLIPEPAGSQPLETGDQLIQIADFDRDGDIDVVVGTEGFFVNKHRSIEAPEFARIGHGYTLRITSEPGYATAGAAALPFVGFAAAALPTPIGYLGVDPSTAVALPLVTLPAPFGTTDLQLSVPNNPALTDLELFFQALMIPAQVGPLTQILSNSIQDRVIGS